MNRLWLLTGVLLLAIGCGGGGGGGGTTPAPNPAVTPPTAPSGVATVVLSATSIRVTWVDNAGNEDGFTVEYLIPPATTFQTAGTVAANVTQFTHSGLLASTNYVYRVKATNAGGATISTNQVNGTTSAAPVTAPAAPSTLGAQAQSSTQINLVWIDNAGNEDGFKIERSTSATTGFAQIDTVGANVVAYSSTGLTASTQYYYKVRATNTAGDSSYSNTANATTLVVGGSGSGTWVEQTLPTAYQAYVMNNLAGTSADDIFATGYKVLGSTTSGFILHKNATSWVEQTIPSVGIVTFLTVLSTNNAYALTRGYSGLTPNSQILHWDGSSWSSVFQQNNWASNYMFALSTTNIYVLGDNGTIIHWDGTSWTAQTSGTTVELWRIWGQSPTDLFIVGGVANPSSNPVILHSTNGTTWSPQVIPIAVTKILRGIVGTSASNIVAVGDGGVILRYNGTSWTKETSGTTGTITGPWLLGGTFLAGVYDGSQGELLQSSGGNWISKVTAVNGFFFFGVEVVSGTSAFAIGGNNYGVGSTGMIYHYDGTNWVLETQARATVYTIWRSSATDIWAAGADGLILRRQ